ncbi:hypothetical protein AMTR_s00028p00239280 [Amborella trichopoda]|uniref:LYK3/RLK10-like LysM domain-containing protein n=1 Tax=Amborella trichopoda TaxID=13333 RepID=W1PRM7_AMBTC|nr:hypothetical protein AMTR_s00028p00239280 [Amborella trichopoda]
MGMNSFCELGLLLALLCSFCWVTTVAQCKTGCDLAFGSYYITQGQIFGNISVLFDGISFVDIQQYNPEASSQDSILFDTRLNITFTCDCNDGILGHTFRYPLKRGDTYNGVARTYANLTDVTWLQAVNSYAPTEIPDNGSLNVTVNCSCGDADISRDYGLFLTYPLRQGENLSGLASAFNISSSLLQRYNPNANYNSGRHLVFIPFKDSSGSYRPLQLSNGGIPAGAVVGIVVAGIAAMSILVICYFMVYKRKKTKASLLSSPFEDAPINDSPYPGYRVLIANLSRTYSCYLRVLHYLINQNTGPPFLMVRVMHSLLLEELGFLLTLFAILYLLEEKEPMVHQMPADNCPKQGHLSVKWLST